MLEEKQYSWKPNKEKVWTITDYIDWGDERLTDYTPHVVLKDELGNSKEIRGYEVVVVPDVSLPAREMVYKYLSDNGLYNDNISGEDATICVSISWGDWKHDHGYLRCLMSYIGYTEGDEIVTEENGSDCYSSVHYFYKASA